MSDFNILIGVDMSNAEKDIKKSISNIGDSYKLKLNLIIGNKDEIFNEIRTIQSLFTKLGNLDVNFGLREDSKDIANIKSKLEGMSNLDLSDIGNDFAESLESSRKKLQAVRNEYSKLMKVVEQEQNNTLVRTETTGDKFLSKRQTKKSGLNGEVIEEGNPAAPSYTRNFEALDAYVSKAMNKIESLKFVTKSSLEDVANLTERLAMLQVKMANGDADFHSEINAINGLIEHYDKLELEMIEVNKTREAQVRESIKWSNKLADVERQNFANPASKKKLGRLIGEIDSEDIKSLDELQRKLQEIQNQFIKIQGQEKNISFGRKVESELNKINKKVKENINDVYTSQQDKMSLKDALFEVENADNALKLENSLKRVNTIYDEVLRKQNEFIQNEKILLNNIKSADKYGDIVDDVVSKSRKQIDNDDRLNIVRQEYLNIENEIYDIGKRSTEMSQEDLELISSKKQALLRLSQEEQEILSRQQEFEQQSSVLQREINQLKERGTELSYEEQRAIQKQVQSLKELAKEEKDSDSSGNSRDRKEQSVIDKFNSVSYRATRGFSENSVQAKELRGLILEIENMVNGLSGKVGSEFNQATKEIEQAMNRLNAKSRELRDEDQKRRASFGGQIMNALKKVPIWAGAMGLVYGTVEQIRKGFQSVLDIDSAMINLAKVSESSKKQLEKFRDTATELGRDLGVVAKDIISATTAFQRLGYTLEESTILGKNSILYANVGDMSVDDASDNLTSTIKGFGIEVDKAGENVREVVDMFNEVSNSFSISASGIGESLKRSSSVMNEAGNTIQESIALAASANAVIQDPNKVGNGLKTIAMRLRGVTEEGEETEELIPKLQLTFDKINKQFGLMGEEAVNIMEEDGETFKSTYKIFEEVVKVWDKLSDIERANIVEVMGGKHQGVIVSAIIQNWKDAESAADTASNSAGSAAREFDAYMDGFEYKIGQLQNAIEKFWTHIIDSDAVKWFIDNLTSMIDGVTKLVDTLGTTTIVSLLGGIAALMGSKYLGGKELITAVTSVTSLGGAFKGLGGWVLTTVKSLGKFVPYLKVLLLIGTAANLMMKAITAESRARKERLKVLDAEISKLNEFQESYEKTFNNDFSLDDFSKLQLKGVTRSAQEEQKYLETINEIKDTMPELISHYNEKNEAVVKGTYEIRELIKANQNLLLQNEKEQFKLNLKETDFDEANKKLNQIADAQAQLYATQGATKMHSIAKEYLENEINALDESNYLDVVDEFRNRIIQAYDELPDAEREFAQIQYQSLLNLIPQSGDKETALLKLQGLINDNENMRSHWETSVNDMKDSLKFGSDEITKTIDEAYRLLIKERGVEVNSNEFLFIDQLKKNMIDNLESFGTDVKAIAEDIPNYVDQVLSDVKNKGISIDELITPNDENFEKVKKQIEDIKNELIDVDPNNPLIQLYDDLILKHLQAYNTIKTNPLRVFDFSSEVMAPLQQMIGDISDLDSAYRELQEGEKLSLSTTIDLIDKHPDLIKYMKMENGVLTLTADAIKNVAKDREASFKEELQINKQRRIDALKTADENIKQMKREMEARQIQISEYKKLLGMTVSANPMIADKQEKNSVDQFVPNPSNGYLTKQLEQKQQEQKEQNDALKQLNADAQSTKEAIEAMDKLLDQSFSSQLGSISGSSKNKKTSQMQDAIYVVDKYAKKIDWLNRLIEKQQKLQGEYSTHTEAYRKSVNEEIYLTEQKKKAIDEEIASLNKQINARKIQKTGLIQLNNNENENKTARAIAAELQQEIDQAEDRLRQLGSESDSIATRINELRMMQVQATLDSYNIQREAMSDDIAYQEYAMNLYDESTQAYRDHANEKLKLVKEQQKYNKQELEYLIKQRNENTNLTNAQINELNELIRAKKSTIFEMAETITEIETLIANSELDKRLWEMSNESKKYADAISDIESKIKYDLNEDGDYGKHISILKEISSLRKGERDDILANIKYLENQLKLYSDNKEMVNKISDELSSWKDSLRDAENAIKDTSLEVKSVYEKISDEYVDLYKEQLQLMQQADEKYYQDKMEAEQKAHDKRIKQIEDEMDALQKAYDKQMKLIDRAESTRDHEQDVSKKQSEIDEIKKQIDILSMDDSFEAKTKKAQLVKELTEKELELSEVMHDREIELRKDNLEDDLESEKEKLEARKDRYQEDFDNFVDSLEEQAKKRQEYWEAELNNEKKFAELRKQVLDGNFDEMFNSIDEWSNNVSGRMSELGSQITENFTYKIQEAISAMKDLSSMEIGSYNSSISGSSSNIDSDTKQTSTVPKSNELGLNDGSPNSKELSVIEEMKKNSRLWNEAKTDAEKQTYYQANQKLGSSIGAVYDSSKGVWYRSDGKTPLYRFKSGGFTGDWSGDEGRLAVLDKKELVLTDKQTEHILDIVKIMEKFKTTTPSPSLANNVRNSDLNDPVSSGETNQYNIEVNINGNADKKVADRVADEVVKKIKRTKGGRY